jgi:hypothetical protein
VITHRDWSAAIRLQSKPAAAKPRRPGKKVSLQEETTMDEKQRQAILAQIEEIAKRHGKTDDESLGELLARAAASGDEQAINLVEMLAGDVRM